VRRYVACSDGACLNFDAPYFDFEPTGALVLCPVCGKRMRVVVPDELADRRAELRARQEADAAALARNPRAARTDPGSGGDVYALQPDPPKPGRG
jgi:uncharacterized Zn finger protein (UPF0148 family)